MPFLLVQWLQGTNPPCDVLGVVALTNLYFFAFCDFSRSLRARFLIFFSTALSVSALRAFFLLKEVRVFGMNLLSSLETHPVAFYYTVGGICSLGGFVYGVLLLHLPTFLPKPW